MKRFKIKILLLLGVVFICLFLGACRVHFDSFVEGDYVTAEEVDNDIIPNIRLELYRIDRQAYTEADGVNVVCDFTKSGKDKYFSFSLYLFVNELDGYIKIDLTNFEHLSHAPTYYCSPVDRDNDYGIGGFTFWFYAIPHAAFTVVMKQNGTEYIYTLSLIDTLA